MNLKFTPNGWEQYQYWIETDSRMLLRINDLIRDTARHPFTGLGKPEPLKGALQGWWSRRITGEHRVVYRVDGKDADQTLTIAQCRYHY